MTARGLAPVAVVFAAFLLAGCMTSTDGASVAAMPPSAASAQVGAGESLLIPFPAAGVSMHATMYLPGGAGPFPLAVVNHASEQDANRRALAPPPAFPVITAWLLAHGYAVLLPERPGHGQTGGPYREDQGACDSADFVAAGNGAADAIGAAITFAVARPDIRGGGVVVIGNSAGGWGALALAARNPAGVRAVVNFAGGRGGHDRDKPMQNCSPDRLVAAAATFGRSARVPTLWLYAENDTYFPPKLSQRMADAFRGAGGKAEYHLFPPVGQEGHALINAPLSVAPWPTVMDQFLAAHQ